MAGRYLLGLDCKSEELGRGGATWQQLCASMIHPSSSAPHEVEGSYKTGPPPQRSPTSRLISAFCPQPQPSPRANPPAPATSPSNARRENPTAAATHEMKRKQGGSEEDAPRCPPHPAFVLGRCSMCGAKEKDAEVGAPGVAVGHESMNQGGDGDGNGNDGSERCPPYPEFVHGLCSRSRSEAEEEKAGGGAPGVAVGQETMNQGGDRGSDDEDDAVSCPPHPEIAAAEEDAGASASGVTIANKETRTLMRQRKLILIMDLDHTLLNSTGLDDLSADEQAKGLTPDTIGDARRDLFRLDSDNLRMLVKLRPYVRGFLEQASAMFEMHVYTLGNQGYAKAAMDLLDPEGVYFGGRVVSIEESTLGDMKSLDVMPGADPVAVVILQDTDANWPGHQDQDNLILTKRYRYFASTCRKSRFDDPSLAEKGDDENGEHGGSLAVALGVLKRVHQAFFDGHHTDVRDVIRELRRQVLSGCTVAFSYLNEHLLNSPESTFVWRLAEWLGAECKKDVDEAVTHVVAEDPGTQKAQWARDNGKFLVTPEWIKAASFRWCRQDAQEFPVTTRRVMSAIELMAPFILITRAFWRN